MKAYRYGRKQFIKLSKKELINLRRLLNRHKPKNESDCRLLTNDKLNFHNCIGLAWLSILRGTKLGQKLNLEYTNTELISSEKLSDRDAKRALRIEWDSIVNPAKTIASGTLAYFLGREICGVSKAQATKYINQFKKQEHILAD